MELRRLRYFVAVAEEKSVARAASRIHIEPSPLARAIKDLEADLGVQLFHRRRGNNTLTWPGEVLLEESRRLLSALDNARSRVASAAKGYRGLLRIGIADSLAQPQMTALLAQYREEDPHTEIRLREMTVFQMLNAISNDEIDAGFTLYPKLSPGYAKEEVWTDRPAVAIPARHPLLASSHVSLQQALRYPLILCHPDQCAGGHMLINRCLHETKLSPTVAEYVSGHESMMMLVAAGYGIGFGLESQIATHTRPDVVIRPVDDRFSDVKTYIVYSDRPVPQHVQKFIDRAKAVGAGQP